MTKITINLATRRYPGRGIGVALPLAIILLSLTIFSYFNERLRNSVDARERIEKRMELSQGIQESPDMSKGIDLSQADMAVIDEVIGQRAFSWINALDNIEKALPAGLSLISIQPSFKDGAVRLSGYAKDFDTLSRFINDLERLKVYKRVFLVNQSMKEVEDRDAIAFNINIEGGR